MRASGQQPAARRADISASKPSSNNNVKPRRAASPIKSSEPAFRKVGKATVGLAAGAALVFGMSFTSLEPAAAAPGNCHPSGSAKKITKGDRGKQVKAAECLLDRAGFDRGKVNKHYTKGDRKGTKAFQRSVGLPATGNVNKRTWTALISYGSRPSLHQGDSGASVERLQLALSANGKNVPATGYYGKQTASRVKSIQRKYGWRATGSTGNGVWAYLQHGGKATKKATPPKKDKPSRSAPSSKGLAALAYAKNQIGDAYSYGANGPNAFDCSGLTQAAYRKAGVSLPHNTNAQYNQERKVSKSELKKGDLVFFYSGRSHVGIYAGDGKIVHAANPSSGVTTIKMKYMPYNGAVRPS